MSKLTVLSAAAAGYVLGARAGRTRYEQIAANARRVMGTSPMRAAGRQARDMAAERARTTMSSVSSMANRMRGTSETGSHVASPGMGAASSTMGSTSATMGSESPLR